MVLKHQSGKTKLQKRKRGPLGIVVSGSAIRQEADFSGTQDKEFAENGRAETLKPLAAF